MEKISFFDEEVSKLILLDTEMLGSYPNKIHLLSSRFMFIDLFIFFFITHLLFVKN